jgi:hypothetical protein
MASIRALASRAICRAQLSGIGKKAPTIMYTTQRFATTSDGGKKSTSKKAKEIVPDEFFDEKVESDKEFLDVAASLVNSSGLEALTTVKVSLDCCYFRLSVRS